VGFAGHLACFIPVSAPFSWVANASAQFESRAGTKIPTPASIDP
jgi:hypothetical protein